MPSPELVECLDFEGRLAEMKHVGSEPKLHHHHSLLSFSALLLLFHVLLVRSFY